MYLFHWYIHSTRSFDRVSVSLIVHDMIAFDSPYLCEDLMSCHVLVWVNISQCRLGSAGNGVCDCDESWRRHKDGRCYQETWLSFMSNKYLPPCIVYSECLSLIQKQCKYSAWCTSFRYNEMRLSREDAFYRNLQSDFARTKK